MNLLLLFLVIAAGEAAFFETTVQRQTADGFQEQESAWRAQDDALLTENKQLLASRVSLGKKIALLKSEISGLNGGASSNVPSSPDVPSPVEAVAEPPPSTPVPGEAIGTIASKQGPTYQDCHLLKVEPDGITFSHSEGISKMAYSDLPEALQKRFASPGP